MVSLETSNPKLRKFTEDLKVVALHSLPSSPDKVSLTEKACSDQDQIDSFYSDTPGLKMLFAKGSMLRTNVMV